MTGGKSMKGSLGLWGKRAPLAMVAPGPRAAGLAGITRLICLAGLVGLCLSCSVEESAGVLGSRSQAPVFLGCRAASTEALQFRFSRPVEVLAFNASPSLPVESIEGGELIQVNLSDSIPGGESYTVDILVKDGEGNTLNVLVPFRSRNDRMPRLLINELRTEYASSSTGKPRIEFVELKAEEEGNLGALRLFIAGNTKKPLVFEFPPAELAAGEYTVLHLRTLEEGTADETGDDLDLSKGYEAGALSRDFWVPGAEKLLHKTDAVYLMDQDDNIIDAVMMSEKADPWWTKDHFVQAADLFHQQGAWVSPDEEIPGPPAAAITGSSTATRSICRDETVPDSNTAADWYVTVTSGATPGALNNPKRFEE
jgi:hypothetical protein